MFDDFELFLDTLANRQDPMYESAWREFDKRYRNLILRKLRSMCRDDEKVHDIFGKFCLRLIDNDFRAIRRFKERKSESALKVYIQQIAYFLAIAELQREVPVEIPEKEQDPTLLPNLPKTFKKFVEAARDACATTKKRPYEIERDILIYLLRKVAGFAAKDVALLQILDIKHNDVDNIIYKLKQHLEENEFDLRDLI